MNTMNVNGQNGVATSAAIKNAVDKAVNMINKAQYGKKGYVLIDEGLRLSFDGSRFFKGPKDNFIFNGKIEKKGGNGRYNQVLVEIQYKNLDNEEGFWQTKMVNAVLDAILNYIDDTIVKCEGGDGFNSYYAEILQNFRYCYFGSRLVVDNTEDLNSPDALDNDIESIMEFFGDDYKALNDIENEFFGYHFDIDDDLRDNLLFKRNGTFIDMYYNNMVIINNSVYIRLTDIKNIRDFENALFKLISTLINNDENNEPDALDNDENDSPDTLEGHDVFIGFENASEECDGNMMACVDKYGQVFIDSVLDKYADVVCNAVSEYDLFDTVKYCVQGALDYMEYDPEKKRLVGCSDVPDLDNWDDDMTIRKCFEKHKIDDGWGSYVTADSINNYVDEFLSPDAVKTFFNLVEKDEDWLFYIDEDGDGNLYVSGNEGIYKTYFDDNVPMVQVYSYLMDKMKVEISN